MVSPLPCVVSYCVDSYERLLYGPSLNAASACVCVAGRLLPGAQWARACCLRGLGQWRPSRHAIQTGALSGLYTGDEDSDRRRRLLQPWRERCRPPCSWSLSTQRRTAAESVGGAPAILHRMQRHPRRGQETRHAVDGMW